MKKGVVFETMRRLAQRLHAKGIPYAVIGGMALAAHGYVSTQTRRKRMPQRHQDTKQRL